MSKSWRRGRYGRRDVRPGYLGDEPLGPYQGAQRKRRKRRRKERDEGLPRDASVPEGAR